MKKDFINKIYLIDSRNRNYLLYPSVSNYKIPLNTEYEYIEEIELISCHLPKTIYTINENNNILKIKYNQIEYSLKCPLGIIENGEILAKWIENTINTFKNDIIKIIYIKHLNKLLFQLNIKIPNIETLQFIFLGKTYYCNSKEDCDYGKNSIGRVLGFFPKKYDTLIGKCVLNKLNRKYKDKNIYILDSNNIAFSNIIYKPNNISKQDKIINIIIKNQDNRYIVHFIEMDSHTSILVYSSEDISSGIYDVYFDWFISQNMIDLNPHKYVLLDIDKCKRLDNINKNLKNVFTEIPLVHFMPFPSSNIIGINKKLNPCLFNFKEIHIKFYEWTKDIGVNQPRLFDFQGAEHILVFSIKYLKQSYKYNIDK